MMKTYKERLDVALRRAASRSGSMSQEQKDVANLIVRASHNGQKLKQKQIATLINVGKNKHDSDAIDAHENTLRKVRQIVRELRVIHRLPIVSNRTGYWIPYDEQEARDFLEKTEKVAVAHYMSAKETYSVMAEVLDIKSEFFTNQQEQLI